MRLWNRNKCKEEQTGRFGGICVCGRKTSYLVETSEDRTQQSWPFTPYSNIGCCVLWVSGAKEKAWCTFFSAFIPQWTYNEGETINLMAAEERLLTTISLQNHNTCFLKTQSMLVSFLKLSLLFCLKFWVSMRPVVTFLIEHNLNWALVVRWGSERDN